MLWAFFVFVRGKRNHREDREEREERKQRKDIWFFLFLLRTKNLEFVYEETNFVCFIWRFDG